MWYSPDEVEFYLIDFKKGVEFKTYATHAPAARPRDRGRVRPRVRPERAAAARRRAGPPRRPVPQGRRAGPGRRTARSPAPLPMPRTLLMIDEFQEFFTEDDKLAPGRVAAARPPRPPGPCVRHSRAPRLADHRRLVGPRPQHASARWPSASPCMTSEADSQLILGDDNSAARLLTRPGEAIYNDQGGLVEGQQPVPGRLAARRAARAVPATASASKADARAPATLGTPSRRRSSSRATPPADIRTNAPLGRAARRPRRGRDAGRPAGVGGRPGRHQGPDRPSPFRRQSGVERADHRPAGRGRPGASSPPP